MFLTQIIITDELPVTYDSLVSLTKEEMVEKALRNMRESVFDICKEIFEANDEVLHVQVGHIENELITTIIIYDTYTEKMKKIFDSGKLNRIKLTVELTKRDIKKRIQNCLSDTENITVSFHMPNGEVL